MLMFTSQNLPEFERCGCCPPFFSIAVFFDERGSAAVALSASEAAPDPARPAFVLRGILVNFAVYWPFLLMPWAVK
jgi:hypothetical protein